MLPVDEFLKRLPADAKEERALVTAALGIPGTLREKISDIRSNPDLSEIGKLGKIKELAKGNPLAHLKQIRGRVAAMTTDVSNLRHAMKPKEADRSDIYGEMQRAELRAFVRAMPPEERLRAVQSDPAMTDAVLLAHPALSGLSPEKYDLVKKDYAERTFGPQLRGLESREDVVDNLNAAVEVATRQFLTESGLTEAEIA
jgi:hypothetical protein